MTLLKTSSLKKITVAVLALALVSWLGVGVYSWKTKTTVPTPASNKYKEQTSSKPVEDWPLYKNMDHLYQLRYPPEFIPQERGKIGKEILGLTNFVVTEGNVISPIVGVSVTTSSFEEMMSQFLNFEEVVSSEEILVGNLPAFKAIKEEAGEQREEVIFPSKKEGYSFRVLSHTQSGDKTYQRIFEQMLLSFSFWNR